MQDRVSLHPGRVTLTPVSGQANTYDLARADSPTQEGTPLNKANLLKDTTAALFGLGSAAVPDDVFQKTSQLISSSAKVASGSYIGTASDSDTTTPTVTLTLGFKPKLVIITTNWPRFYDQDNIVPIGYYIWVDGVSRASMYSFNGATNLYASSDNNSFSFYCTVAGTMGSYGSMNDGSVNYYYVAIG